MRAPKYDPSVEHDPLFDVSALDSEPAGATEGSSAKAERAIGSAWCPEHNGTRKTGVIRQGTHVVWRLHDKRTVNGLAMPCRSSGVPLCEAQPRFVEEQVESKPPRCTHSPDT